MFSFLSGFARCSVSVHRVLSVYISDFASCFARCVVTPCPVSANSASVRAASAQPARSADVVLIPANKTDADNTPDFRIRRDDEKGPEIGAAWKETGDRAGDYLSFQIDDPAFAQPIRANLFRSDDNDDAWSLHWNRPKPRKARS